MEGTAQYIVIQAFLEKMYNINKLGKYSITVYHDFYEEVDSYKYVFKCDGPCTQKPPYYGLVKRAMNRPPNPHDHWYADHLAKCGGTFHLIEEPPNKSKENIKQKDTHNKKIEDYFSPVNGKRKIDSIFTIKSISIVNKANSHLLVLKSIPQGKLLKN
jgi:hypothetical protein